MIDLEFDSRIATATLNAPPVNAINEDWIEALNGVVDQVQSHGDISVLRIRSNLKAFCGGADLSLMRRLLTTDEGRDAMIAVIRRIQDVLFRVESLGVVTVAEIGGAALGGGLELALACDLRVASERAKVGLPEASLGLLPGAGGTQRLPRIAGEAVARRLILGAEVIDGAEAARLSVVHWAVPAEELSAWTDGLVRRLSGLPPEALAGSKACIAAARDDDVDGYALELSETRRLHDVPETQKLISAFLDRSS